MNIFYYICQEYFKEESFNFTVLIILGILLSLFYTNLASYITANIINNIKSGSITNINYFYFLFIGVSILYLILYYIYKMFQTKVLIKVLYWVKHIIVKIILKVNNYNLANISFIDFMIPITRIASSLNSILYMLVADVIPTICFLLVISGYFIYKNFALGITFFFANMILISYFLYFAKDMFDAKIYQETETVKREKYLIDLLNNFDKVIYKGQSENEINTYEIKTNETIDISIKLMDYLVNHCFVMNTFVYVIIFSSIWYLIKLQRNKDIDVTTFITFFTIIIMYRDSISNTIHSVPSVIEHSGRIENMVKQFNTMIASDDWEKLIDIKFQDNNLTFEKIKFENVNFKYDGTDKYIFKNLNIDMYTKNKIIGVTGLSGRGKSTFMKLLLRIYPCSEGSIMIDDIDIKNIDPIYIRDNITYVNQNSRLFDRIILENILYGCNDLEKCNSRLKEILKYPKINELYKNIDISSKFAGPLGENLSGGQRQITNIISGLINPSSILILDEPTNALDPGLKSEILKVLHDFKKYKKCIIIITHDKEVNYFFDETIKL